MKHYALPELPFDYSALEPVISSELLRLHHDKHHRAYVDNANALSDQLEGLREKQNSEGIGDAARKLSFNVGGAVLHSLFWQGLRPPKEANQPGAEIEAKLVENFFTFDQFKNEFFEAATTIEGSGWAGLSYSKETGELEIVQIGNHNLYLSPNHKIFFVLDMWEHAYYPDYKNDKKGYAHNFWQIANWEKVNELFLDAQKKS